MRFNRSQLLASSVLAGTLFATGALAQVQPSTPANTDQTEAAQLDEIVVTGSRIRRSVANAPTPLIQVTQEQILSSGQTSLIDQLATIPALQNSTVPSDTTGGNLNTGGLSLPNLRSLGASRTLTLVNGRRHVGSSGGSLAVDVDTIPRLLIQNVEIITGGASSVYGTDAVSGVLNFITRSDFEGLEIDANYGQINADGQATQRISALIGKNFFDDRLNVYAHGEYEKIDEVQSTDINFVRRGPVSVGIDADPTNNTYDGITDGHIFYGVNHLGRLVGGQTTLGNQQRPSDLTNPNVNYYNCFNSSGFRYNSNCFAIIPGKTFVYDGLNARDANFGQRIGNTGISRPYNLGGDGTPIGVYSGDTRVPESESQRFQVGANFRLTDSITAYGEAKYVKEETRMTGQPTFFDIDLDKTTTSADEVNALLGTSAFRLRYDDNAYLAQSVKNAIDNNRIDIYGEPTADAPGALLRSDPLQVARHAIFGPRRSQENSRELQRYVGGFKGDHGGYGAMKSFNWDIGYTYGKVEVENIERGVDTQRMALAADAVFDTAGVLGTPGAIVCRSTLLNARGLPVDDYLRGGDLNDSEYGRRSLAECKPMNVFGAGNMSQESLDYVDAFVVAKEVNEQHQAIASASTELWDLFGAGNLGLAFGGEWRKETTSAVGRSATAGDRLLFLNIGADLPEVGYESKELFAEVSLPLFRDSVLGEYAELSGSYRWADYSNVGNVDVYGVNLVYRPIRDLTFKASYNTSVRVPNLSEQYDPYGQTYATFTDPCSTPNIIGVGDNETRQNRIANCTALASQQGLTFDFAGATPETTDDFRPVYTSSVEGSISGNPNLRPEESESFTFSVVYQPRFLPGLTLNADYFEIRIDDVISYISASGIAANCVSGAQLNAEACSLIFRKDPDQPFAAGDPSSSIGAFIQRPFNFAALETRGLDFGAAYTLDTADFGRNWGQFDYRLNGSWLIEQKNFLNEADPSDYDELAAGFDGSDAFPRVRLSSSLTWKPNDTWNINWTADWQSAVNIVRPRDFINNADRYPAEQMNTGNYARHDLTVRYNVNDDLTLRGGVVNLFDADQRDVLGTTIYSNYDPYGRRFFVGLNYKAW